MLLKPDLLLKIKRYYSIIRDIALNLNLIQGHLKYTKFIILCRSRTGSNLLLNQLQFHENVRMFYEVFSPDNSPKEFWDYINHDIQIIRDLKNNNPIKLIDDFVYREMPLNISAVGFKLFYYHARKGKQQEIWQYLEDRQDIKIIHLVRRNLLKVHVSQQMALATNSWYLKNGKKLDSNTIIELDYEQTRRAFEETKKLEAENEIFLKNHQILKIFYEDIVQNNVLEMEKIQNFLEVKHTPVYISTKKQSTKSLPKKIKNYSELKTSFQGSPYASFFE
ncbi:putative Sulfotransferase [Hyella patelloides LEGE 07179]|uniref:Putative Sulfotransferase n=1 Tax=Hyella patelloides LEGE 07179 TaxID=945734 RepID=A0A563W5F1_9CYAN|nr:sulfotransferase [Hyella patelloides]VEP18894.1 putative Sulfotransferase [Hyella patelloides LEGE 07179]